MNFDCFCRVSCHSLLLCIKSERGELGILISDAHRGLWSETLEHRSTHHAMEKLSRWFNPASGNEGGNYVLTRNDSDYLGGISIIVQDALTFSAGGTLGTIGGQAGQGFTLDGAAVTTQFSLDLDAAQVTLNWTVANGTPQTATFVLVLYHDAPAFNSVAFYADTASDQAAYSLNILML